jgi:hypothetical protein
VDTYGFVSSLVGDLAWPVAAVVLGLIFRQQLRAVFIGLAERMKHLVKLKAAGTELSFGDTLLEAKSELTQAATVTDEAEVYAAETAFLQSSHVHNRLSESGNVNATTEDESGRTRNAVLSIPLVDPKFSFDKGLLVQVQASPESTVLRSWLDVENAIKHLGRIVNVRTDQERLPFTFADQRILEFVEYSMIVLSRAYQRYNKFDPTNVQKVITRLLTLEDRVSQGGKISKLEAYDYASTAMGILTILGNIAKAISPKPDIDNRSQTATTSTATDT